ncbi:MAG TPA: HTTM domain-containing protein [Salinimicrobium sp.]|nr:HTTM domain-containing protein [Salinimicrobium sp.]
MLNKWLFTHIDNSALIVFRIIFGALCAIESIGAIFTGWVRNTFIEPQFTFTFIGFGFLQPLPGNGMLWYYAIMGLFGILVMLGFKYRFSMFMFTLMWAAVYFMQKSSYNNHYYLLLLLSFLMILLPAHRYASLDARHNPEIKRISMPQWCWLLLVLQLFIVYTFAAIAKLYPGWLDATFASLLMKSKADLWLIGGFLQQDWIPYVIAYFGIFFDFFIIPLLLWKRTRMFAFVLSLFFHLFNSLVFHIGIFPYLSLAFILFFFPSETINKKFLRKKPYYRKHELKVPDHKKLLVTFLSVWFIIQIALPLRHWFFKDDVLWTEEGHRLSWRMMLRAKSGRIAFKIVDKDTKMIKYIDEQKYLTPKQAAAMATKPDLIWQFAQFLEEKFAKEGKDVAVYVGSKVSVNGGPYYQFIDPKVDIAAEEWKHFEHHDWILPSPLP